MRRVIVLMKKVWRSLAFRVELTLETWRDSTRYCRHNPSLSISHSGNREHLESDIIQRYHVLEKGLSMRDFHPRFGKELVIQLVKMLRDWDSGGYPQDHCQILSAKATLSAYLQRHEVLGVDIQDILPDIPREPSLAPGGVKSYFPISGSHKESFEAVLRTRASVRSFLPLEPEKHIIESAVEVARFTPSVCNRQTWRVHVYFGNDAQKVLKLQNGNRGFGHLVPCVLVVTSDLRYFAGVTERYQAWIDGGMFSMSLLLQLHAMGLGAVSLNWSVMNDQDVALRASADIPDSERIIMLIGCGYPAPETSVAVSARKPVSHFLTFH